VKNDSKGRSCTGKTAYTKKAADEAAWWRSKTYLTKWAAYRCKHCPHWHIGHSTFGRRSPRH
jgi:hypothetical protein